MRGPNIYIRCLYGLRSGIPEEQDFALHHLVKVSFERGDKYKFEGFPQLAEALLEKALEISVIIHGTKWKVSYEEDAGLHQGDVLNGVFGTDGLFDKLQTLPILADEDTVEPADFTQNLVKLNEAALVLRNMMMLEENSLFMSKFPLLRDFLIIALNLPEQERLSEFRQYALDIVEQVTKHWELNCSSAIYQSVTKFLYSQDRGAVLSAARAIARIGMDSPRPNRLTDIPVSTISALMSYLVLECDDELLLASLDIIYQYTAVEANMHTLYNEENALLRGVVPRLASLLLHNAQPHEQRIRSKAEQRISPPTTILDVPQDLYNELLTHAEPDRSNKWLRCCFEEAENEDITQIAIWQAYQGRFNQNHPIPAAEFIKNVSSTFKAAQAKVIHFEPPLPPGPPRFIIRGIRPKRVIVGLNGEPFLICQWQQPGPQSQSCGSCHRNPEMLWTHIVEEHFHIPRDENGNFSSEASGQYRCAWPGCTKHANSIETNARAAAMHVRLHVMRPNQTNVLSGKASDVIRQAEYVRHTFYTTPVDNKGMPMGISHMAVLVLKNIARYANRQPQGNQEGSESTIDILFGDVKFQLTKVFSVHKTLRFEIEQLLSMLPQPGTKRRNTNQGRRSTGQGDLAEV